MSTTKITFARRYDHHVGNGTHEHYPPGSTGEFPTPLANALMYEGFGTEHREIEAEESEGAVSDMTEEKSEGDAPANKMKKAAPENKSKK